MKVWLLKLSQLSNVISTLRLQMLLVVLVFEYSVKLSGLLAYFCASAELAGHYG